MNPSTHATVFLGLSRQQGWCGAQLALSTPAAPLSLKCAASGMQHAAKLHDQLATASCSHPALAVASSLPVIARNGTSEPAAAALAAASSSSGCGLLEAGFKLTAKLHLEEPGVGPRHLHPCVRPECGCLGVFYTGFGGGSCRLCVTIGVEASAAPHRQHAESKLASSSSSSSSSSSKSSMILSSAASTTTTTATTICTAMERFQAECPSVCLFSNACGQDGLDSTTSDVKICSAKFDELRNEWKVWFKAPKDFTTGSHLAQARIQSGTDVVMTGGFEVRTKPHKWLLLQNLPEAWTATTVESFVKASDIDAERKPVSVHKVTMVDVPARDQPASADAAAGDILPAPAASRHAFIQLKDRSEAHQVMRGFRSTRAASSPAQISSASSSASSKRRSRGSAAASSAVLASSCASDMPAGSDSVMLSFLAGLSRAQDVDPSFASVPVPVMALACPRFVQPDSAVAPTPAVGIDGLAARPSKRERSCDDSEEAETDRCSDDHVSNGDHWDEDVLAADLYGDHDDDMQSTASPELAASAAFSSTQMVIVTGEKDAPLPKRSCSMDTIGALSRGVSTLTHESLDSQGTPVMALPMPVLPISVPQWRVSYHAPSPSAQAAAAATNWNL